MAAPTTSRAGRPGRPRGRAPGRDVERGLWAEGHEVVVGVDEVGRGSWAGPLSVGAVVIPRDRRLHGIRDSKQLAERRRDELADRIGAWAVAAAVGHATAAECDELGMSAAQRLATRRALGGLSVSPDVVVTDGRWDFVRGEVPPSVRTVTMVRGDARCLSIAAASVLAKATRDRLMRAEAEHFPAYHFDQNKGYPCPRHQLALQGYGPSAIHRRSWVFMDRLAWLGALRTTPTGSQLALFP